MKSETATVALTPTSPKSSTAWKATLILIPIVTAGLLFWLRQEQVQQLTHTPDGVFNYAPAFSPSGRLIVFERYASASDTDQIFTMRTDGSQLRQLTFTGAGVTNCCPDWQPLPSGG